MASWPDSLPPIPPLKAKSHLTWAVNLRGPGLMVVTHRHVYIYLFYLMYVYIYMYTVCKSMQDPCWTAMACRFYKRIISTRRAPKSPGRFLWEVWHALACRAKIATPMNQTYLAGGSKPSEKYERQLGWWFPIYGKIIQSCSKPPTSLLITINPLSIHHHPTIRVMFQSPLSPDPLVKSRTRLQRIGEAFTEIKIDISGKHCMKMGNG